MKKLSFKSFSIGIQSTIIEDLILFNITPTVGLFCTPDREIFGINVAWLIGEVIIAYNKAEN